MTVEAPQHTTSPMDRAYGKWLSGDKDGALRLAAALVHAQPDLLDAVAFLVRALIESQRPFTAAEVAMKLVDACTRRGDFAGAVRAASLAEKAGEPKAPLVAQIAAAFSKESPRLKDGSPAPPPLPQDANVPSAWQHARGDALYDKVEQALVQFLAHKDTMPEAGPLPRMPLFGFLQTKTLEKILQTVETKLLAEKQEVFKQGDEGTQAYVVVRGMLSAVRGGKAAEKTLALLGPGAFFGEMALVSEAPRAATVRALEPSELLVFSRTALEALAKEAPAVALQLAEFTRGRMVSNLLRHSVVFRKLNESTHAQVLALMTERQFAKGEYLVKQGEEGQGLFLIASGTVEVRRKESDGEQLVLSMLGPGDVVGEMAVVLRRPASADVRALHPLVALHLKAASFQTLISTHPTLLEELYTVASQRDDELRTVVAQETLDASDALIV